MKKEFIKRLLSSIVLIPLSFFFIIESLNLFILFITVILIISLYEWNKINKKIYLRLIGSFYLILAFYCAYLIRHLDLNFFLFLIIICVSTDLGGYFFGKLLGGPKLIKISPNKTYSGMIGSFFLSIITSFFFLKKFHLVYLNQDILNSEIKIIYIVLLVSLISQTGDLIISYLKRQLKIKDTGKILPGHGGILDRIDGMIFVFPLIYLFSIFL